VTRLFLLMSKVVEETFVLIPQATIAIYSTRHQEFESNYLGVKVNAYTLCRRVQNH
jgi:hypothetical protein